MFKIFLLWFLLLLPILQLLLTKLYQFLSQFYFKLKLRLAKRYFIILIWQNIVWNKAQYTTKFFNTTESKTNKQWKKMLLIRYAFYNLIVITAFVFLYKSLIKHDVNKKKIGSGLKWALTKFNDHATFFVFHFILL